MVIPILFFLMKISGGYLAGSETDWLSQHIVFPEYFRQRFYETGNLFPDFAMEIGGGQNIYNFGYYGLYNPLYLLSYLLPFVDMAVYVQGMMLATWIADGLLCYLWLLREDFREEESFFASFIMIMAGPVVFHTSMQIMFVSYLPFLLLTLIGYDRYCRTGKYALLTLGVFCMVLTSFYFAVGGVAALLIYGLCGWKKEWASSPAVLIRSLWKQFYPAFFGGLLSFFYLVPVFFAMLGGRSEGSSYGLKELLTPQISLWNVLYTSYGMGLTAMAVVILAVSLFYRRGKEKYLAVCIVLLLVFPAAEFLLNGGLYLRTKAYIPFLPLIAWLAAAFLKRIREKSLENRRLLAGYLLAAIVLVYGSKDEGITDLERYVVYADLVLCGLFILIGVRLWKRAVCAGLLACMAVSSVCQVRMAREYLVEADWMEEFQDSDLKEAMQQIRKEDTGLYRMEVRGTRAQEKAADNQSLVSGQNVTTVYSSISNADYETFREEIFHLNRPARNSLMQESSDNPIFLDLMGVKYLLVREDSGEVAPEGYEKIGEKGNIDIYKNESTTPVGYVTDQIISDQTFESLSWPERQLALSSFSVAGDRDNVSLSSDIRETDLTSLEQTYDISKGGETQTITLEDRQDGDQYLFLCFDVENHHKSSDVSITVNGETNKQSATRGYAYPNGNKTFYYVCSLENADELEITFGEGSYEISHVKAWYGSTGSEGTDSAATDSREQIVDANLSLRADGDSLAGSFTTDTDGYLITSIPYDDSFTVLVDGQEGKTEKVNGGFLGVPADAGKHEVEIQYHAQGKTAGLAVTAIAGFLLAADWMKKDGYQRKKRIACPARIR